MYALNPHEAMKGDERSSRINEIGKYIGVFTRAEDVTSRGGARGVDFAFETDSKQSCNFTLWTFNKGNEPLHGGKQLQTIMACLSVRNTTPRPTKVKKYDREQGGVVEVVVPCFTELMNRRIGLLLETEDYERNDGAIGTRMVFAAAFQAETELMATEILNRRTTPQQLAKVIPTLRHRPLRNNGGGSRGTVSHMGHPNAPGNGADFADDDIPF